MIFSLEIDTAGMPGDGIYAETARILRAAATRVGDGEVQAELNGALVLRDLAGRVVGRCKFMRV